MPIDFQPSQAMAEEAERGLAWREEFNRGGTEVGVARARDISNRRTLSPDTVQRMVSYFARHEVDKEGEGFSPGEEGYPSAGRIAWALWGGDPGQSWANKIQKQIETERENKMQIQIENKSGKVKLTEDINQFSVEKLTEDIGKLFGASAHASGADFGEITNCAENAIETLEIEINSPGGSIFDGYTIYQEIKSLQERGVYVTATVTGMAASMASVICMACNEVQMVPHGRMMIHEASQGVRGNAEELRKAADLLDGLSQNIAEIYAGKTGKDVEDIREMMKQETWMTAPQSLEYGFIDKILDIRSTSPKNTQHTNNPMSILSKLFPGNDEVSKLEASIAENEYIRTELEIAQNKIQELSGLSAIIVDLEESKAKAEASLAEAQATIAAKDAEIEEVKASIPSAIVESLSAIGQEQAIEASEEASAEIDHIKELSNLKGSARTAYYNANQAEIKKQLKK